MPRLHVEAAIFCLAWAAVAVAAGMLAGFWAGALVSLGLLMVLMPTSALILSKTEDFALERQVRWGLLAMAALALAAWLGA